MALFCLSRRVAMAEITSRNSLKEVRVVEKLMKQDRSAGPRS